MGQISYLQRFQTTKTIPKLHISKIDYFYTNSFIFLITLHIFIIVLHLKFATFTRLTSNGTKTGSEHQLITFTFVMDFIRIGEVDQG